MLHLIIIPLIIITCLVLVIKNHRHSDALFSLIAIGSVFAFLRGAQLLDLKHPDSQWQGVALIAISLIVALIAAIAFKAYSKASK